MNERELVISSVYLGKKIADRLAQRKAEYLSGQEIGLIVAGVIKEILEEQAE